MCGIIAVVRRRSERPVPSSADLVAPFAGLADELRAAPPAEMAAVLDRAATATEQVDRLLRASGTEPLIRVMVEAPTHDEAAEVAARLASAVSQAAP